MKLVAPIRVSPFGSVQSLRIAAARAASFCRGCFPQSPRPWELTDGPRPATLAAVAVAADGPRPATLAAVAVAAVTKGARAHSCYSGSRYSCFNILAGQIWLSNFGCPFRLEARCASVFTCIYECLVHFIMKCRSPCLPRSSESLRPSRSLSRKSPAILGFRPTKRRRTEAGSSKAKPDVGEVVPSRIFLDVKRNLDFRMSISCL